MKMIKRKNQSSFFILFLHLCVFILCILSIPVNFFFPSHSTSTERPATPSE